MIEFFTIESARERSIASYDAIVSISKPARGIPGLRTMRGKKPELILAKGGSCWADCLTPDFSHLPLVFSDRVIQVVIANKLKGLDWMELECDVKKNRKLAQQGGVRYFQAPPSGASLRFTQRVFEKIGGKYGFRFETSDRNDQRLRYKPRHYVQFCPIDESWDGSDFMIAGLHHGGLLPFGGFYCTRRVVELARREGWSNLSFTPADYIGVCGGDFRKRPWPPEQWYPANHPPSVFSESDASS